MWLPEPHGAVASYQGGCQGDEYPELILVLPSSVLHASHGPNPTRSGKARELIGAVHTQSHAERRREGEEKVDSGEAEGR